MKRFLLTILAIVLIAGVLAGAGFTGYRFGYRQGTLAASKGDTLVPPIARGEAFHWKRMPMEGFGPGMPHNFPPRWRPGDFGMMHRGRGFWIFPLFGFLIQLAIVGFIVWLVFKLLTGWRFTLTRAAVESPKVEPSQPVESEPKSD